MKIVVVVFIVFLFFVNHCAAMFPLEVRKLAEQNGCSEVSGFFERPGMVEPAFLYGYASDRDKPESVVFWCQSSGNTKLFKLIAIVKGTAAIDCVEVIHETRDFPGGLSFANSKGIDFSGFISVEETGKGASCDFERSAINSFYDGVGHTFLFRDGIWLYKLWD